MPNVSNNAMPFTVFISPDLISSSVNIFLTPGLKNVKVGPNLREI